MICQPEFVNEAVLEFAKAVLAKKRPALDLSKALLFKFQEGLCVQCIHIGPYDTEATTIAAMTQFALDQGYMEDLSETRGHHEIYLGDPPPYSAGETQDGHPSPNPSGLRVFFGFEAVKIEKHTYYY
jgi:hypothetical protein